MKNLLFTIFTFCLLTLGPAAHAEKSLAVGYIDSSGVAKFEMSKIENFISDIEKSYDYHLFKDRCLTKTKEEMQTFVDSRFPNMFLVSTKVMLGYGYCRADGGDCVESSQKVACKAELKSIREDISIDNTTRFKVRAKKSVAFMRELYNDPSIIMVETNQHDLAFGIGRPRLTVSRIVKKMK